MQLSTDAVRKEAPAIQIYVAGRGMIRLYESGKWVGMTTSYRLAQQIAAQLEQARPVGSVH